MTCLCESLWGNRMISSWFFQSFDLEEQPFLLASQKAHLQQEQILLKALIPHSPIQLVPQAVFPLIVEDVPVGWHFKKKILFLKLCFTIKSSKFVFCKMTYLQHCIYACVCTDVYIKNGLVLVCNQGLEKFHPLLLKPPFLSVLHVHATTKPWRLQIGFLCLQFWLHPGITDMAWNRNDCFAWLPSLGAMFLRLIRVTFRFKNVCLSIARADFRDPNVRL